MLEFRKIRNDDRGKNYCFIFECDFIEGKVDI